MADMRYREAVEVYKEIVEKHANLTFDGKKDSYAWAGYALERAASCQERLGDLDGALLSLKTVLEKFPGGINGASLHYRMGRLLESVRRDAEATTAYAAATNADKRNPVATGPSASSPRGRRHP